MLGGADNPNGELLSYIIGADNYVCSENPLFHSAYHHPLYISKRIISG